MGVLSKVRRWFYSSPRAPPKIPKFAGSLDIKSALRLSILVLHLQLPLECYLKWDSFAAEALNRTAQRIDDYNTCRQGLQHANVSNAVVAAVGEVISRIGFSGFVVLCGVAAGGAVWYYGGALSVAAANPLLGAALAVLGFGIISTIIMNKDEVFKLKDVLEAAKPEFDMLQRNTNEQLKQESMDGGPTPNEKLLNLQIYRDRINDANEQLVRNLFKATARQGNQGVHDLQQQREQLS